MWLTKVRLAVAFLLVMSLAGVGAWVSHARAAEPAAKEGGDVITVPSRVDGVLLVVGTDIREGEKVPPHRLVTVKSGGEEKTYRRLKIGDRVEEGQLLARVDDSVARAAVAIVKAKVTAADADWQATVKTRDEAEQRYRTLEKLLKAGPDMSTEELRAAKLTYDRYFFEEIGKKAAAEVARVQLDLALICLAGHEVRSPVRGVIVKIYAHRGEAVKAYGPVFQVQETQQRDQAEPPARQTPSEKSDTETIFLDIDQKGDVRVAGQDKVLSLDALKAYLFQVKLDWQRRHKLGEPKGGPDPAPVREGQIDPQLDPGKTAKPEAPVRVEAKPPAPLVLTLRANKEGELASVRLTEADGTTKDLGDSTKGLTEALRRAVEHQKDRPAGIVLKADPELRHKVVVEVLDACRAASIEKISMVVNEAAERPATEGDKPAPPAAADLCPIPIVIRAHRDATVAQVQRVVRVCQEMGFTHLRYGVTERP